MSSNGEKVVGRKIRRSCSACCSGQKIRCGKERPSCARCSAKGLICKYSPSLRTGRHPRPRVNISEKNETKTQGEVADFLPVFPGTEVWPANFGENVAPNGSHFLDDQTMTGIPGTSGIANANDPSNPPGLSGWSLVGWDNTPEPRACIESNLQPFPAPQRFLNEAPLVPTRKPSMSRTQHHPACHPQKVSPACTSASQRDCYATLLHLALEQLHSPSQFCAMHLGNHRRAAQTWGQQARDVDTILIQNRDAVRRLSQILDCSCMDHMNVKLAAYMVSYKIVSLYGAITGGIATFIEGGSWQITDNPVVVGSYTLDDTARRSVRARAVLNELELHVQPMLNKLPRFYSSVSLPEPPADSQGKMSSSLGLSFNTSSCTPSGEGCMLRTLLQRVRSSASANDSLSVNGRFL